MEKMNNTRAARSRAPIEEEVAPTVVKYKPTPFELWLKKAELKRARELGVPLNGIAFHLQQFDAAALCAYEHMFLAKRNYCGDVYKHAKMAAIVKDGNIGLFDDLSMLEPVLEAFLREVLASPTLQGQWAAFNRCAPSLQAYLTKAPTSFGKLMSHEFGLSKTPEKLKMIYEWLATHARGDNRTIEPITFAPFKMVHRMKAICGYLIKEAVEEEDRKIAEEWLVELEEMMPRELFQDQMVTAKAVMLTSQNRFEDPKVKPTLQPSSGVYEPTYLRSRLVYATEADLDMEAGDLPLFRGDTGDRNQDTDCELQQEQQAFVNYLDVLYRIELALKQDSIPVVLRVHWRDLEHTTHSTMWQILRVAESDRQRLKEIPELLTLAGLNTMPKERILGHLQIYTQVVMKNYIPTEHIEVPALHEGQQSIVDPSCIVICLVVFRRALEKLKITAALKEKKEEDIDFVFPETVDLHLREYITQFAVAFEDPSISQFEQYARTSRSTAMEDKFGMDQHAANPPELQITDVTSKEQAVWIKRLLASEKKKQEERQLGHFVVMKEKLGRILEIIVGEEPREAILGLQKFAKELDQIKPHPKTSSIEQLLGLIETHWADILAYK